MSDDLPAPAPNPNPETEEFWEATKEGTLLLKQCNDCGRSHHYPRTICPNCGSDDTEWTESTGVGTVYSYTVNYEQQPPYDGVEEYVLGYVQLDDGPRIMTNIVGVDPDDIEVGQVVEVTFDEASEDADLYRFTPQE